MLAAGMDNTSSVQKDFEQNDRTTDDIFDYLQSQYIAGRYQEAVAEMEKASNGSSSPTVKVNMSISAVLASASEDGEAIPYPLHCQPIHSSRASKNTSEGGSPSPSPQSMGVTSETKAEDPMYTLASEYAGQPNSRSGGPNYHIPSMLAPLIYRPDREPRATLFCKEERKKEEAGEVAIEYSNNCVDPGLGSTGTGTDEEEDGSSNMSCPSSPVSNYGSDQDEEDVEIIVFKGRAESAKALIDTSKIPTPSGALAGTYKEVCVSENNPFSESARAKESSPDSYHAFLSLRGGGGDNDSAFGPDDDDDESSDFSSTISDTASKAEDAQSEDEETIVEENDGDELEDDFTPSTNTKKLNRPNVTPTHLFYPKSQRGYCEDPLKKIREDQPVNEDDGAESDENPPRSARNRELRHPTPKLESPSLHPNSEKKYGRPTPLDPTKGAGAQPSRKKRRAEASRTLDQESASDASKWLGAFHTTTSLEEKLKKKMLRDGATPKPKEERRKKPHKGKNREVTGRFNKIDEDDEDEGDLDPSLSLRGGGDDHVALGPDDDDDSAHSTDEDAEVEIISAEPKHAYAEDEVDDDDTAAINALRTNFKHIIRDPAEKKNTEVLKGAAKAR